MNGQLEQDEREQRLRAMKAELIRMTTVDPGLVLAALVDALIEAVTAAAVMGNRHLQDVARERFYSRLLLALRDLRRW